METLKIYLADLTYNTVSIANEAFPLNIGYVGAYCKERFGSRVELTLFKYIEDLCINHLVTLRKPALQK